MKIRINRDGKTADIINEKSRSQVYGTVHRTFEKRNERKETYILTFNEVDGEVEGVAEDVLFFARSYAKSKDAMLRIDGQQYMDTAFDETSPLRPTMFSITNIYVIQDKATYINTITKTELNNLVDSGIDITYAPMSNIIHNGNYAVYRVMRDTQALIKLGCNRRKELALPWMIIDEDASDLSEVSLIPPKGKLLSGLCVHDMLSKTKKIKLPYVSKSYVIDDEFNINVCGKSRGLINMNFGEFSDDINKPLYLSGFDYIRSISVDLNFLTAIFDHRTTTYEKRSYAKIIMEIFENSEDKSLLPLCRRILEWSEEKEPAVFKLGFSDRMARDISINEISKTIEDYSESK